jgi:hypothetical protein
LEEKNPQSILIIKDSIKDSHNLYKRRDGCKLSPSLIKDSILIVMDLIIKDSIKDLIEVTYSWGLN